MKSIKYFTLGLAALAMSCDVDKTESGSLPEVEVETEAGNLPEYDVDWAEVNIGQRTKTVEVPKVVVVMEEEEVEVPFLDVDMPNGEKEEMNLRVEAEVSEYMHELDIQKVYAKGNKLMVISRIEKSDSPLDNNRVRISDQIVINAPDNLSIKHFIIGDKPEGGFNNEYRYVSSESELSSLVTNARLIYEG